MNALRLVGNTSTSSGEPRPLFTGGGEPPTIDPMEARMRSVEQAIVRIDATLPMLATKADLADTRAELHKFINAQTWKFITWMTGICGALVASVYFIARSVH